MIFIYKCYIIYTVDVGIKNQPLCFVGNGKKSVQKDYNESVEKWGCVLAN